jgi:hypothetical protein
MTFAPIRTPDAQLLDSGSAECVAGGEHDGTTFGPVFSGNFPDRRRLAGAVDPDDEHDERLFRPVDRQRLRNRRQSALDLFGEHGSHFLRIDLAIVASATDRLGDALSGGDA